VRMAVRSVAEEPIQPTWRLAGISAGVPIARGRNRPANNATRSGITAGHRTHANRLRTATWWDDHQQPHPVVAYQVQRPVQGDECADEVLHAVVGVDGAHLLRHPSGGRVGPTVELNAMPIPVLLDRASDGHGMFIRCEGRPSTSPVAVERIQRGSELIVCAWRSTAVASKPSQGWDSLSRNKFRVLHR
jgi:hypothetical protein